MLGDAQLEVKCGGGYDLMWWIQRGIARIPRAYCQSPAKPILYSATRATAKGGTKSRSLFGTGIGTCLKGRDVRFHDVALASHLQLQDARLYEPACLLVKLCRPEL